MKKGKSADTTPSPNRKWYNDWVKKNAEGSVLDVGKSRYWDYGFPTLDTNKDLKPTFIGDICNCSFPDETFDVVLCNGLYEFVMSPQRMVDECIRILKPGGKVIFGFVGRGYKPYKQAWLFYEKGDIKFEGVIEEKDFSNYHIIVCQKN